MDKSIEEPVETIKDEQKRKKLVVLGVILVIALALVGVTILMYGSTPAEQPAGRIGTEAMENVSEE